MNDTSIEFETPHELGLIQTNRRAMLLEHVDIATAKGLEVGPYSQPTVLKSEGSIAYLDVDTRDQLIAQLSESDQGLASRIPSVEFLCPSGDYPSATSDKYDYVIANHVLEHAPNMIAWLQMVAGMLAPEGILFLSLPDKKFTFDKYRPDTPLSHLLYDFYTGVTETSYEHMLECELYYDQSFIGKPMTVEERLDPRRVAAILDIKMHPGVHCHVFRTETFQSKVLKPLQHMGLVEFELLGYRGAKASTGGEFNLVLRKRRAKVDLAVSEFFGETGAPDALAAPVQDDKTPPATQRSRLREFWSWISRDKPSSR